MSRGGIVIAPGLLGDDKGVEMTSNTEESELIQRLKHNFERTVGNARSLRAKFLDIADILKGEFSGDKKDMNVYPQGEGAIVSMPLLQGREKDPTVGLIAPGSYLFETGDYRETMIVLDGPLSAGVAQIRSPVPKDPEDFYYRAVPMSTLNKYGSIIAPPNSILKLAAFNEVLYVCFYDKPIKYDSLF